MKDRDTTLSQGDTNFPETLWSRILRTHNTSSKDYKENLDYLVAMYWKPVYKYIRISWKKNNEEAKDLTQDFFTKFLEKNYFANASPDKSKFRTYVKASLKHFLINMKIKGQAQKRGGSAYKIDFQGISNEKLPETEANDPVAEFDKEWAKQVITSSIDKLQITLKDNNKEVHYKVFEHFYFNPMKMEKVTRKTVGKLLGISEIQVRNYLIYARNMLRVIIEEEIARYVTDPQYVEEERKYLLSIKL